MWLLSSILSRGGYSTVVKVECCFRSSLTAGAFFGCDGLCV